MEALLTIGFGLLVIFIGVAIYFWSSIFKKLGIMSQEELNEEGEKEEDLVTASETTFVNYLGSVIFLLIGITVWSYLGITIGKIASDITQHSILKWIVYVFVYFIFLRFPFGVGNKMIKRSYAFEKFPEKILFSFVMIASYVFAICCYKVIPWFFKWHLQLLNL